MARYSIDFEDGFDKLLTDLAKQRKVTKSEIIRNAVASYNYLIKNASETKKTKVSITDDQDKVVKDVVLP